VRGFVAFLIAFPALGQTVVSVDNLGNITSAGSLSAVSVVTQAGIASGAYGSGLSATGSAGQTCIITFPAPGGARRRWPPFS